MHPFPTYDQLKDLIQLARREDLAGDDVTSRLMVREDQRRRRDARAEGGRRRLRAADRRDGLPGVRRAAARRDDPRVPHGDHRGPLQRRPADAAAARPRADAVAAVGRARGAELPPAHVRRRDAHAPVRPPRRGHRREDLRHAQDRARPPAARQVRRPLRRGVQPPRRALRRPARQGQPPRRRPARRTCATFLGRRRRASAARKTRAGWSRSRSTTSSSSARC